jgi:hypothetical protein
MRNLRYVARVATAGCLLTLLAGLWSVWPDVKLRAILNGQPDGTDHPYVGLVTDLEFVCSGSAISPTVFVTAAHCFDTPGKLVAVTFDPQGLFANNPTFYIGRWFPDPDFCIACAGGLAGFDTHDVAVVVFNQPVARPRYAQLPAQGLVDLLPMRTNVDIVGYGVQKRLKKLGPTDLFTRFAASANMVQSEDRLADEFLKLSANPAQGKGGICFGDSGGPVLLGGTDTMLGINSFVSNTNCAGVTYHYRIDLQAALAYIDLFLP